MPEIFHIASAADWARVGETGEYTTSTRGRSLAEEGFIHAARRDQLDGVRRAHYADADEPLVVLTIDTARLSSPWREEQVGGEWFPHIYGPLNADAVTAAHPLHPAGAGSFTLMFVQEMLLRILLAFVAMMLAVMGTAVGRSLGGGWAPFAGGVAGLALGAALFALVMRRRR